MTIGTASSPAIMVLGRDLGDLVEGAGNEVGELHFHDRAQAHHRGADGGAHNTGLGQRRIEDSPSRRTFGESPR